MFAVKFFLSLTVLPNLGLTGRPENSFDTEGAVDYSLMNGEPEDVKYRLFTTKEDEAGKYYHTKNISLAKDIHKESPTRIFIHDYAGSEASPWYKDMKDAYFGLGEPCNILYIDWHQAANKTYAEAAANTKCVGMFIAEFILEAEFDLCQLHVIGHSLGAHVAGKSIHAHSGLSIGRITATDPAWAKFENDAVSAGGRLSKYDACFVDVIHTDSGYYGFTSPIGHIDYYPNGGYFLQPRCPPIGEDDMCSHLKSNEYFLKSITDKNIKAFKCKGYLEFRNKHCANNPQTSFGEYVDKSQEGVYYLDIITNY